ncbi:MAG: hypothetical protein U0361_13770 [Nitrospiraceae bacterium]
MKRWSSSTSRQRALYSATAEKAPISQLVEAVEEVARKRDDHRVFTLIASYRIRPAPTPRCCGSCCSARSRATNLPTCSSESSTGCSTITSPATFAPASKKGYPSDSLLAARAFIGMVVHHRLLHEIFEVPLDRSHEDTVSTYVELLLNGLRNPSPEPNEDRVVSGNPISRHPIVTLGVILFAVTAPVVFRLSSGAKVDGRQRPGDHGRDDEPHQADLDVRLTYTADLIPNQLVNIFFASTGYIAKIYGQRRFW